MLSFEQAIYEASLFTSTTKARYDFDYILVTEATVVATDGKRLYMASIENPPVQGYLRVAYIKGGLYRYPKPKQNIKGYTVLSDKDIEMLGTRFDVLKDVSFPPYQNIIPERFDPILLDTPELFLQGIKDLYQYGKKAAQEYLYTTGDKVAPRYRAVLYKNGNLNLVLECSLGGEFVPISHVQLAKLDQIHQENRGHQLNQDGLDYPDDDGLDHPPDQLEVLDQLDFPDQQDQVVFDPKLYSPIKCAPVAIALKGSNIPVVFQFLGRKLYLMPITGVNDLKDVENFVHWEVYEEETIR